MRGEKAKASQSKRVADALAGAIARRKEREAHTYGLYSIKRKGKTLFSYMPPFLASCDDYALKAVIELSRQEPRVCGDNLYRIADFCTIDGKIKPLKMPRLIVHQAIGHDTAK